MELCCARCAYTSTYVVMHVIARPPPPLLPSSLVGYGSVCVCGRRTCSAYSLFSHSSSSSVRLTSSAIQIRLLKLSVPTMHAMQCMPHAKHEALNTTGPVPSHDFNLRVEPLDLDATEERLVDGESEQDNITAVEQARCRGQGRDRHGSDSNDGSDSELGTQKGGDKDDEVEPQIDENEPKEDPLA